MCVLHSLTSFLSTANGGKSWKSIKFGRFKTQRVLGTHYQLLQQYFYLVGFKDGCAIGNADKMRSAQHYCQSSGYGLLRHHCFLRLKCLDFISGLNPITARSLAELKAGGTEISSTASGSIEYVGSTEPSGPGSIGMVFPLIILIVMIGQIWLPKQSD